MNFDLSRENRMIRDEVRQFARKEIAPHVADWEASGEIPPRVFQQMGALGLMGIPFPEECGGMGGDWVGMHVCIEEISRADIAIGLILDASISLIAQELFLFGTEAQKRRWLSPIIRGEQIGAFALTEPDSGSDTASIRTTAVRDGDEWVLSGTKQYISNIGMPNATLMIVAAVTESAGSDRPVIATFLVPRETPGVSLSRRYKKLGMMRSATHEVVLNDCRVPAENLLGDERRGLAQHLSVLETGRISVAAMSVGLAQACLDEALSYAKGRRQFGCPIFDHQAIRFKLADMAAGIELARNQYLKAAWLKDQGRPHTFETAVAKLFASEMVERAASEALQIQGGYGYMEESPVSRYYREAKLNQIIEGTSEIQRLIIGRVLAKK